MRTGPWGPISGDHMLRTIVQEVSGWTGHIGQGLRPEAGVSGISPRQCFFSTGVNGPGLPSSTGPRPEGTTQSLRAVTLLEPTLLAGMVPLRRNRAREDWTVSGTQSTAPGEAYHGQDSGGPGVPRRTSSSKGMVWQTIPHSLGDSPAVSSRDGLANHTPFMVIPAIRRGWSG